jgi:serine/threonine protein kinase
LEQLLSGQLPISAAAPLEQHLENCRHCLLVVDGLRVHTPIMDRLTRLAPTTPVVHHPDLCALMRHLEDLGQTAPLAGDHSHGGGQVISDDFPFLAPAEASDEIGRLGRYRVLRLLGAGGMGFVFLAEDPRLKRLVALKVLQPGLNRDPRARERFLHEARAMAAVKHDHIAVVYEADEADPGDGRPSTPYLSVELLSGESLQEWMRSNRRPRHDWVVRIGRQAAAGLAAAHSAGLIHRDIKPSNLWLEAPPGWPTDPRHLPLGQVGRVKLIDFGLVAPLNAADLAAGDRLGTPAYMAPEQLRGEPLDGRCDLFALGCVLYELCTGDHLFPARRLGKHLDADVGSVSLQDLNVPVPPALAEVIDRLIAFNPANRIPSASELERQLAALEAGTTLEALPGTDRHRHGARLRRRRTIGLAGAGLVILGALWLLVGRSGWMDTSARALNAGSSPGTAPADGTPRPPFPQGPPDDVWCQRVRELPPDKQFRLVALKMEELNPGYDHRAAAGWVEPYGVVTYGGKGEDISDIRPLRALTGLMNVRLDARARDKGRLSDLSPLAGLHLRVLTLANHPHVQDLTPLRGMSLNVLDLQGTGLQSLRSLEGLSVRSLNIARTAVTDLSPVPRIENLRVFDCRECPVKSLEPLSHTGITDLWGNVGLSLSRDVLVTMPALESVNGKPAGDLLKMP